MKMFFILNKTKGLLVSTLVSVCVLVSFQNCNNFNAIKDSITSVPESNSLSGAANISSKKIADDASIFYVENFGAVPDVPSADSTDAIRSAIAAAIATQGPAEVVFGGGHYRVVCGNPIKNHCFNLDGAQNITLRGLGDQSQILIANPNAGAFEFDHFTNISIHDLSIDYETPPFTQGRIAKVSFTDGTFDVVIDKGFPSPMESFFATAYSLSKGISGVVYQADAPALKGSVSNYVPLNPTVTQIGTATYRFTSKIPDYLTGLMSAGDRFVLVARGGGSGITAFDGVDIRIQNVSIFAGPVAGVIMASVDGSILIDSLHVTTPSQSTRLMSTCADAIHLQGNRAKVVIQNSLIQGMGDDAINLYSVGSSLTPKSVDSSGNTVLSVPANWNSRMFHVGDQVQLFDSTLKNSKGRGIILSVLGTTSDAWTLLVSPFNSPVASDDVIFDVTAAGSSPWILHNTFGPFRGEIRIRSESAVLAFNQFLDPRNAKVRQSQDSGWNEGPGVPEIQDLYSNTVTNGTLHFSQDDEASWRSTLVIYASAFLQGKPELQPPFFDPSIYAKLNPDLGGMSADQLAQHWISNGQAEGRQANLYFSAKEYLSLYSDLAAAFGASNFKAAADHYYSNGRFEGRSGSFSTDPQVFSAQTYKDLNLDLAGLSKPDLIAHWLLHGIDEGRRGNLTFDSIFYLSNYPDVKQAVGSTNYRAAVGHYVGQGISSGRRASLEFNSSFYQAQSADLNGMDNRALSLHWLNPSGIFEGRDGSGDFSPSAYLRRYSDLAAAYGSRNFYGGLLHWITCGKGEGRNGTRNDKKNKKKK